MELKVIKWSWVNKMKLPFQRTIAWCTLLSMVASGCASYDSPFVYKTEQELDAMEWQSQAAADKFESIVDSTGSKLEEIAAQLRPMADEQTVSQPLYQLEMANVCLLGGKKEEAHQYLMAAREHIELLFDEELEDRAVSLWHGENNKVFKGEPHERATMYSLLALSFIEKGDFENATRCVKNGLFEDTSNEGEEYNSDYALLHYLGYISAKYQGDEAQADEYKREFEVAFKRETPKLDASLGPYQALFNSPLPNAFVVLFNGKSPEYVRGGEYDEIRHLIANPEYDRYITYKVEDDVERQAPMLLADINFQAMTRGGRVMDDVLNTKASVKSGMEASRNICFIIAIGALSSINSSNHALPLLAVAGVSGALGASFWIVGEMINSTADIRHWRNLPGEYVLIPLTLPDSKENFVRVAEWHGFDQIWSFPFEVTPGTVAKPSVMYTWNLGAVSYARRWDVRRESDQAVQDATKRILDHQNWMEYEVTE